MGHKYLKDRIHVNISLEKDKYEKLRELVGERNISSTIREFVDDLISQNKIDEKLIDERFKLYFRLANQYDHMIIRLFIKSLTSINKLGKVTTNSRLLFDLARERKNELVNNPELKPETKAEDILKGWNEEVISQEVENDRENYELFKRWFKPVINFPKLNITNNKISDNDLFKDYTVDDTPRTSGELLYHNVEEDKDEY